MNALLTTYERIMTDEMEAILRIPEEARYNDVGVRCYIMTKKISALLIKNMPWLVWLDDAAQRNMEFNGIYKYCKKFNCSGSTSPPLETQAKIPISYPNKAQIGRQWQNYNIAVSIKSIRGNAGTFLQMVLQWDLMDASKRAVLKIHYLVSNRQEQKPQQLWLVLEKDVFHPKNLLQNKPTQSLSHCDCHFSSMAFYRNRTSTNSISGWATPWNSWLHASIR